MKKLLLLCGTVFLSMLAFAQITTEPTYITQDYAEDFAVIFDATQGSKGMIGAKDCYAHTGVITAASKNDSDWKHSPQWGDNDNKYKLESIGKDLWKLTIKGGIAAYYGLEEGEVAKKLVFVFRNSTSTQEGKGESGGDIIYELYPAGKYIVDITSPDAGISYEVGEKINIKAAFSAQMETAKITIDDVEVYKQDQASSNIEYEYTFTKAGKQTIKVIATKGEDECSNSLEVLVLSPSTEKALPEGLEEGINYPGGNKVVLVFRAPLSKSIYVLGDFNNWEKNEDYHMYRHNVYDASGNKTNTLFWLEFELDNITKKYAFQYLVDDRVQVSDPYSKVILDPWNDRELSRYLEGEGLPAYPEKGDGLVSILQIEDENPYQWEVTDFKAPKKEDLNIYELCVRDFVTNKRLSTIQEDYLDYIEKLGVNAIELMPVSEFDGNNSWGYDPNHYFAYDKAYGNKNEYKAFIDECHKRGIAVIIDMVFNHGTGQQPFAKLYWEGNATAENNPWYNRVATHPYNVFHDINHEYEGTRMFFKRVLKFWLEEYKVDGFRMDLTKGLTQTVSGDDAGKWGKYDASRIVILKDYYSAVKETKEDAYFILEHLSEYKEEQELANAGMLPWRNMNNSYNQAAKGTPGSSHFVDNNKKGGMYTNQWVGYAESHDEERNMFIAKEYGTGNIKTDEAVRLGRVPALIAFSQLLPGPKMMWQFGEMGYDYSINYCGAGKPLDDGCRTSRKPIPWILKWDQNELRMNTYYQSAKVINLRSKHPAFFREASVTATNCNQANFSIPRRIDVHYVKPANDPAAEESIDIIILANFHASENITTSGDFRNTGIWYNYMTGEQVQVSRTNKTLTLKPGELLILTSRQLDNTVSIDEATATQNGCLVYPTVTNDLITVVAAETPNAIQVYNLTGNLVASNTDSETISMAQLIKGTYLVRVQIGDQISTHKIIKQ
jgi:1,4-alpha-glucan branching enzyme